MSLDEIHDQATEELCLIASAVGRLTGLTNKINPADGPEAIDLIDWMGTRLLAIRELIGPRECK